MDPLPQVGDVASQVGDVLPECGVGLHGACAFAGRLDIGTDRHVAARSALQLVHTDLPERVEPEEAPRCGTLGAESGGARHTGWGHQMALRHRHRHAAQKARRA